MDRKEKVGMDLLLIQPWAVQVAISDSQRTVGQCNPVDIHILERDFERYIEHCNRKLQDMGLDTCSEYRPCSEDIQLRKERDYLVLFPNNKSPL